MKSSSLISEQHSHMFNMKTNELEAVQAQNVEGHKPGKVV